MNKTNTDGSILTVGLRVAGGSGDDYDEGTIDKIDGNMVVVRWDSLVITKYPIHLLSKKSQE